MVNAGYSPATARTPHELTNSKAWRELVEKHLSDEFLAKKHKELLNKKETRIVFNHQLGEFVSETTDQPDTQAVSKGLDMAYKLKGKYAPEKSVSVRITATADVPQSPEALKLKEEYEARLREQLSEGDAA
jgi:hypothetical protein